MDEQPVTIGGELKVLGDGKVGGTSVRFGDAETPDARATTSTADTDFGIVDRAIGWVHHRQPMESPKTGQKARYAAPTQPRQASEGRHRNSAEVVPRSA